MMRCRVCETKGGPGQDGRCPGCNGSGTFEAGVEGLTGWLRKVKPAEYGRAAQYVVVVDNIDRALLKREKCGCLLTWDAFTLNGENWVTCGATRREVFEKVLRRVAAGEVDGTGQLLPYDHEETSA